MLPLTEAEAFVALDSAFRRFSIHKTEMMPYVYVVEGVVYHGMGDFTTYKSKKVTLAEAVEDVLRQYYGKGN